MEFIAQHAIPAGVQVALAIAIAIFFYNLRTK